MEKRAFSNAVVGRYTRIGIMSYKYFDDSLRYAYRRLIYSSDFFILRYKTSLFILYVVVVGTKSKINSKKIHKYMRVNNKNECRYYVNHLPTNYNKHYVRS